MANSRISGESSVKSEPPEMEESPQNLFQIEEIQVNPILKDLRSHLNFLPEESDPLDITSMGTSCTNSNPGAEVNRDKPELKLLPILPTQNNILIGEIDLKPETIPSIKSAPQNSKTVISKFQKIRRKIKPKTKKSKKSWKNYVKKIKKYVCPNCKKEFPNKVNLANHIRFYQSLEKSGGPTCSKKKALKHRKECNECHKSFSSSGSLHFHKIRAHGYPASMEFKCGFENCGKTFFKSDIFERHQLVHDPLSQVECKFCGKFYAKLGIHKHILNMHTKDYDRREVKPNFICDFKGCGKKFQFNGKFKEHQLTHDTEKVACSFCGKLYAKSSIRWHKSKCHKKAQDGFVCTQQVQIKSDPNSDMNYLPEDSESNS